jgi:L-asparaginase II
VNLEPLVVTTRESSGPGVGPVDPRAIENVHHGSIAVMTVDGGLKSWAGDPHWSTFTRSTLKPFQAVPFVREGGHRHFDWSSRQVALLCASHSGEPMHTDVVSTMLSSADCDESQLQCGCHVPSWYAATGRVPPTDATWSPIQNNCSGKHAGFLAACRLHREPVDDYLDPSSPSQRRVAATVADLTGLAPHEMPSGIDGCSAPNYALPLSRLAHLYAQLAQGSMAPKEGESLGVLFDAMTQHPELVSGTARSDRALMSQAPGDWVTKIGAGGVQAIGIRSAGIGIAIKIADGDRDALYCAVVETLRQLGLLDGDVAARGTFEPWLRPTLRNARGTGTGRIAAAFTLRTA